MLFRQIVLYALLVGAAAGLVLTAVQFWQVIPIIERAEHYEEMLSATPHAHEAHGHDHGAAAHDHAHGAHDHDGHAHASGLQRTGLTLLSNVLIGVGFGLLLLTAMAAAKSGRETGPLNWGAGVLWGGAGYLVFFLAPAIGLAPEIPGAEAAALEARQLWWLLAVVCTAGALAGVVFLRSPWRWAALGLLVVPHVVGVPQGPAEMFGAYPATAAAELEVLMGQFFGATAIANGVFWLALGLASVAAMRRIAMPVDINAIGEYGR